MTKRAKKTVDVPEATPIAKGKLKAKEKALRAPRRGKSAPVLPLPAKEHITGSVVPQNFKVKAGKSGVMRQDDLDKAVRNAFLFHGSNDRTPQESARIATDEILADNQLDEGRWANKNAGMLSMNLRNVLRGLRRNGQSIIVRGKVLPPISN